VVVNKQRPLAPQDYAPADLVTVDIAGGGSLRAEAAAQMQALLAAYTAETGGSMAAMSSYRSYSRQVDVYNGWVSQLGQEAADLTSARPGFSEHQTGLAMDMAAVPANCSGDQCFGQTTQGLWLAAHSWEYGFIIRYPDGYTPITGYEYEPWHVRYVGVPLATEMHTTGVMTLEEMFGLPAATTY
jgi:D-alanyl-D-alanine carboxypeptidase